MTNPHQSDNDPTSQGSPPQYGPPPQQYGPPPQQFEAPAPQYGPPPQFEAPAPQQYDPTAYNQTGYGAGQVPPGYGQPAYAQASYASPGATNSLAIAALVCALAGFVTFISAPVGAILGHVARKQIKENGGEGDGMALAGIIVGWSVTGLGLCACGAWVVVFGILAGGAGMSSVN